jgi:tetratricopeptide (TPR) repeat protein
LFLLLTLAVYVSYVRRRGLFRYLLTLLLFALGLMSKPMLVTLPFLLLLLDYWPLNRFSVSNRKPTILNSEFTILNLLYEKIPFFVLSIASSVITFLVQHDYSAVADFNALPLEYRITNVLLSYVRYTVKLFWPRNLAVFYPFDADKFASWQVMICVLLLFGISIFVIHLGRNHKYLPVGWFWFVGTLVPVIGIVQVGMQAYADRYTYIPYIGLLLMIAWGLPELFLKWPQRKIVLGLSMVIVLTILGICTHRQVGFWNDIFTLFSHTLNVTQNNFLAHNALGAAYNNIGRYQDSIESNKRAIKCKPDYAVAYVSLGATYQKLGRYHDAIESYKRAIKMEPGHADVYYNLGISCGELGRWQDAIEPFKQAISIKQDFTDAYFKLGVTYDKLGRHKDAIASWKQAVIIKPDFAEAYSNIGAVFHKLGRYQDAIEPFKQAIRIKPDLAVAHYNLGAIYANLGRYQDAIESYKQTVKIKPDFADAHFNLGVVYLAVGDQDSALEEYKILKTLDAKQADQLYNLIHK